MLRVLGRANSVNVQKVMWLVDELGLKVERVDVGGKFGGNDTAEYKAKNPLGLVPVLEDGDYVIWESQAIVRYLADAYGKAPWQPADAKTRGHANQWMDFYLSNLHPPMTTIFWQLIRTPEDKRDTAALEAAKEKARGFWSVLDRHLADKPFVTGKDLTIGDIPCGCAAYRWHTLVPDGPALPNLRAWWDRLNSRPAYKKNVMLPLT